MLFERAKLVVEPSAAVPLAALLANKVDVREKRVGIIVSGGNLDPSRLTQIFAMDGDQGASRPN
jgi:threonine dehydratase